MGHPLSAFAKVSTKLTFLNTQYVQNAVRIKGWNILVFGKKIVYILYGWYLNYCSYKSLKQVFCKKN